MISLEWMDVLSDVSDLIQRMQVCRPHPRGILYGEAEPGPNCEEERALGANKVRVM